MALVYGIFIPSLRKVYVGVTGEPSAAKRWWAHVRNLRIGRHHCAALQSAFDDAGEGQLVFRVLERMPVGSSLDALCNAEQSWVDRYGAMGCLLNTERQVRPLAS